MFFFFPISFWKNSIANFFSFYFFSNMTGSKKKQPHFQKLLHLFSHEKEDFFLLKACVDCCKKKSKKKKKTRLSETKNVSLKKKKKIQGAASKKRCLPPPPPLSVPCIFQKVFDVWEERVSEWMEEDRRPGHHLLSTGVGDILIARN